MSGLFEGKVALITGGSSGIGLATARRFVDEGAQVVLVARTPERLKAAVDSLGASASSVCADVGRLDELDAVARAIKERHGRLDILFANAGAGAPGTIANLAPDQFDLVFAVNVKGVFFLAQKVLPLMSDGGSIVLTTTIATSKGMPGSGVYAASKAALRSLARTWAAELKSRRIRVNAVSPGPIDTPMTDRLSARDPEFAGRIAGMAAQLPVGRIGRAEEVAAAVAFLASEQASFVNGFELVVDGGLTQV